MEKFKNYLREEYYKDQLNEWDLIKGNKSAASAAVGWCDGRTNQIKRFQTLLDIGVQENDSVIDLGCGLGHLVEYLEENGLKVYYTGIDTNDWAIEQGYQFNEATYIHGTAFDIQENYDWGLASGTFNVGFPKEELIETVNQLLSKVNKGVAFNLLKRPEWFPRWTTNKEETLTYENYTPEEIRTYFKGNISIVEDYGVKDDFTVYIRK
tara:strand:+ start:132 stop:758 length:627 start_codon:yes stop_codon:yes gene_type:complete